MTVSKQNAKRKNDIALIVGSLLSFFLIGILLLAFGNEGTLVRVTVDGALFGEYPLSEDCVVEIRTDRSLNILVIENGRARIREASCPDGICTAHRPIALDGESIICLPNRVVVTVVKQSENEVDIVA